MKKIKAWFKKELVDYKVLLRSVPAVVVALFVLSVVEMNLLANKELFVTKYLALDCGFTLSWLPFLCMDMICKRFGSKAAMKISVLALGVNLGIAVLFSALSFTPGRWGEYYSYLGTNPGVAGSVNAALNTTIGGNVGYR